METTPTTPSEKLNREDFVFFWGGWFSQWAKTPFIYLGKKFNTAEQFMMYHKAILFGDTFIAAKIMETDDPREQKALGRKVKDFNIDVWNANAREIVYTGNLCKFTQHYDSYKELMDSNNRELVEASPEDRVWGIGLHSGDDRILDRSQWDGTNWLGQCLMKVRETLKKENFAD